MINRHDPKDRERWARLRFAIIGPLLAAPPANGDLQTALKELSRRTWQHPITGAPITFGTSTLERWYYITKRAADPVASLKNQPRQKTGHASLLAPQVIEAIDAQYRAHPSWSVLLHYDNLKAALGPSALPSYPTLRRYFRQRGLNRTQRRGHLTADTTLNSRVPREVRSFEVDHVNSLWHLDFHHGSRSILSTQGQWIKPLALCVLDDRSRLACHVQWYTGETTQDLVHGVSQALQRRSLPRALYSDNGAAMRAEEFDNGLHALGILPKTTLPYAAYMNGKQEHFWANLEARLRAMLEGVEPLTLALLNQATLAWVELDYHRSVHRELRCTPLERYRAGPDVGRPCPDSDTLRRAFRIEVRRTQRLSDGSLSLAGQRFEVPTRFRHIKRLCLRYARWDLTRVDLVDEHTATSLSPLYPVDKSRNADAIRRTLDTPSLEPVNPAPVGMAPLLKRLMAEYAATGLPPAYIPTDPHANA
jgi:transposase InsO family protein